MTVSDVRGTYLAFMRTRGHAIIPSAPIVPENDPTTLFTSSGMQPLVPYLLGQPHPEGARLADSQLSFRAEDIEEVGDNRHTTFFEMLGNWSLGDYFKAEQLPWFFEFLTSNGEGLGLDPSNLYVTTFAGDEESGMAADEESIRIWQDLFAQAGLSNGFATMGTEAEAVARGMREGERIFAYGAKKNWWSRSGVPANMPPGEIGGPDSEVFYDFGLPHDPAYGENCHPNCDCGRFIEIGNSVFIQYLKQPDGSFNELPKRNVDFGGGLERLAAATRGNPDVFLIDVFDWTRSKFEEISGKKYGDDDQVTKIFRIILDHMRAALFMMGSGVRPSNTEQGYVLRRLLRRSIFLAGKLKSDDSQGFIALGWMIHGFIQVYKELYPQIDREQEFDKIITEEETKFRVALGVGMREFEKAAGDGTLGAQEVFDLYTTYGFPIEMTEEMAAERGITIDRETVAKLIGEHQERSRAGAAQKFAGGLADHAEQTVRYHTAHHLLLRALQTVLGPEVHQRGSNITSERLRMDFSYGQKMTPEQIKAAEEIVNRKIQAAIPVIRTEMRKEEAEKLGAEHEFGANYPDMVSVYSIGPLDDAFSIEFCGGPHVTNTSEVGEGGKKFRILKEEASSAGVRRIRAILE